MRRVRRSLYAIFAVAAGACSASDLAMNGDQPSHDAERGRAHPTAADATSDSGNAALAAFRDSMRTREPGVLNSVAAAPVEQWTGPGGRPFEVAVRTASARTDHERRFGRITLPISLRAREAVVRQYPCTSCHLGRRIVMTDERIEDVHRNIQPKHPQQAGATCSTCHSSDNVELLALRGGQRATLEHTYRLCAQCHFSQAESWAAGAHGKRLDGWQGRRVVMGCADCHDPHEPALEQRIPFRAPRLERPRSPSQ